MKKISLFSLFVLSMLLACGDESGNSSSGPGNSNTGGQRVDPVLLGTWIPLDAADDTLVISESEYRAGTMAIYGNPELDSYFYASGGQMGLGNDYSQNVLLEYVLQNDTLHVEFQNLAVGDPDGVVVPGANAVDSYTRALQ